VQKTIKKLLFGKQGDIAPEYNSINHLTRRRKNVTSIWNNDHHNDFGIEKILRLGLASSHFLFPGTYIKHLAEIIHPHYKDLSVDLMVIIKLVMPICILFFGFQHVDALVYLQIYLSMETLLQVPTLIFASDAFSKPISYTRSMILVFLNYMEILLALAVVYAHGHYLNHDFAHWFDPIYYSFMVGSTIGFGDYYPVTLIGKVLSSFQAILFFLYVVLFMSYFNNKIEQSNNFDPKK